MKMIRWGHGCFFKVLVCRFASLNQIKQVFSVTQNEFESLLGGTKKLPILLFSILPSRKKDIIPVTESAYASRDATPEGPRGHSCIFFGGFFTYKFGWKTSWRLSISNGVEIAILRSATLDAALLQDMVWHTVIVTWICDDFFWGWTTVDGRNPKQPPGM